jgi:glycosyltransferase involved in cell wall biosynthesis
MASADEFAGQKIAAVSVIIPTYNRAHCLPRALESVLRQTFDDIEVIVVDDCSKDETQAYLSSISDPRLRVIVHEKNKGGSGARNTGIRAARADLIAFQDSDDEWLVTKLEKQMEEYRRVNSSDYGAVYCGKVTYGEAGRGKYGSRQVYYAPYPECEPAGGDILLSLLKRPMISTQTLLVRRDLLQKIEGFDESLKIGQDWDLTTRLARHTKFIFIEEPLGLCFIEPDSISKAKVNLAFSFENILKKNIDVIEQHPQLHADFLLDIARTHQKNGRWRTAMPRALQALKIRPSYRRSWMTFLLALLTYPLPDRR